jgi:colanic acid/amylovoran biosynthesis protein
LIGINVSGLLLMGGYTHNNMFGLKTDYACLMREIIGYFVREHQANVLLVPHVFGDDPESDVLGLCGRV